jgi:putative ABC transport system substrate-binding protein
MRRRHFLILFGGAVAVAPFAAGADRPAKVFRIGILANLPVTAGAGAVLWGAFIQGLRDLGYVEGQNITIEWRVSEGRYERLPDLAAELVGLGVDVIVVPGSEGVLAAEQATRTIPIVMADNPDPVGAGLVDSIARPGGNITGLSLLYPEIAGKQLQLLKEIVPEVSRVAVLWNPTNQANGRMLEAARVAAQASAIQLQALEARAPDDFETAFAAMTREGAGALLVLRDGMLLLHRQRLLDLATKSRLPAMYAAKEEVVGGGLVAYGPSSRDSFRRAATYVDKILKGAKPADLPIEQPTKFELLINLKTAKALGIAIPQSILARADEVIE